MKTNQLKFNRRIPLCRGVHPKGGFVAWPNKQASAEEKKMSHLLRKRRERRGFIAWPENEKAMN